MVDQGVTLMLVGMGTVFLFLTILVAATALMSRAVLALQPVSTEVTDEELAAITAAVAQHRRGIR